MANETRYQEDSVCLYHESQTCEKVMTTQMTEPDHVYACYSTVLQAWSDYGYKAPELVVCNTYNPLLRNVKYNQHR